MRLAEFVVPRASGDAEDGELIVYYFGGTGPKGPYFLKLTGPAATIDQAGAAFEQFLESLAYK